MVRICLLVVSDKNHTQSVIDFLFVYFCVTGAKFWVMYYLGQIIVFEGIAKRATVLFIITMFDLKLQSKIGKVRETPSNVLIRQGLR